MLPLIVDLAALLAGQSVDLILASDILYSTEYVTELYETVTALLRPEGAMFFAHFPRAFNRQQELDALVFSEADAGTTGRGAGRGGGRQLWQRNRERRKMSFLNLRSHFSPFLFPVAPQLVWWSRRSTWRLSLNASVNTPMPVITTLVASMKGSCSASRVRPRKGSGT